VGDAYTTLQTDTADAKGVVQAIRRGRVRWGGRLSSAGIRLRTGLAYVMDPGKAAAATIPAQLDLGKDLLPGQGGSWNGALLPMAPP